MGDSTLDAVEGLLSVGATPRKRRSSRVFAAAKTRRAAEAASADDAVSTSPFAAASRGDAAPATMQRRSKQLALAIKDIADGCDADGEADDGWEQDSPPASCIATPRKAPISTGKGRRPASRQRTSRYMGVGASNRAGQWQARILVHGKVTHLGYYADEEQAARAYDRVSLAVYGNAPTNFPASQYSAADIARLQTLDRASLQQALGVKPMQKSSRFRGVSRKKGKWEAKVMVSRKWAYRELFNSEEAAARAYDAAVWQLKPYEVAKAYVNFKDECPAVPSSSHKAAKVPHPAQAAPSTGRAGSAVQRMPALPSLRPVARQRAPVSRHCGGLMRCETAPGAVLALGRANSSEHSLSGGAGGASESSRASSATRVSGLKAPFGGGAGSGSGSTFGGAGSGHFSAAAAAGAGGGGAGQFCGGSGSSAPGSPVQQPTGDRDQRSPPPPLPCISLGWPSAPLLHLTPAGSPRGGAAAAEQPHLRQVQSAGSMVAGMLPQVDWLGLDSRAPVGSGTPLTTPMAVDVPEQPIRDNCVLSPPRYAPPAAMQRDGFAPGGNASDAAGMMSQTQAWSKDAQRPGTPAMPQLPRTPLRATSAPYPQQPGSAPSMQLHGSGSFGNVFGAAPPLSMLTSPGRHTSVHFQPPPSSMQTPSPGHPAATISPWGPDRSPRHRSQSPFPQPRLPRMSAPELSLPVMRSASTGALASQMGHMWMMSPTPAQLPRSASFAGNPQAPLPITSAPYGLHPGLSAEYSQDIVPELLSQQVFKQEPQESLLHMNGVHIGGEELMMFGAHGPASGDTGTSEFEGMFDD